jgi:beta-1,4-N-acetylglucosaminyltransferase
VKQKKICIVASCGGHLTEMLALKELYQPYLHFFVLNDEIILPEEMQGRTYVVSLFERDLNLFTNIWEAWKILRKERPDLILSSGAGIIVPFALVGKLLGVPSLYVEAMTRVTRPSLTGRIMYHLADKFFYQWPKLDRYFPKGSYSGPLI